MSKLERFVGKPIKKEIDGIEFDVYPLTVKNLPLLLKMQDKTKQEAATQEVLLISLKRSFPDATQTEIDGLGLDFVTKYMEAVSEANGLNTGSDNREQAGGDAGKSRETSEPAKPE